MYKIIVGSKSFNKLIEGNLWIFANEIITTQGEPNNGDIVDIYFSKEKFFAKGYYNSLSQIRVRILTYNQKEIINDEFFLNKIQRAWDYRKKIGYIKNCRLVFGEGDFLPGLIIDKFGDYFSIQTLSLGIDLWKSSIVKALEQIFPDCKGIYERNDVPVRELEGMDLKKGFLTKEFDTNITIEENNYKMFVDLENGQKTGYFLDQQDNRKFIANIVKNVSVLDAFSYTGSFGISAAVNGAKKVTVLDSSNIALEKAKANFILNNVENKMEIIEANAFDKLKEWVKENKKWDVVCIDPPAFTKSRSSLNKAVTGYKEINLRALKLVKDGGFLVTSSCTNLVTQSMFLKSVYAAVKDSKKQVRQIYLNTQSPDHPILNSMENTHYLKFLVLQVMNI